jgi:hypothetical protein
MLPLHLESTKVRGRQKRKSGNAGLIGRKISRNENEALGLFFDVILEIGNFLFLLCLAEVKAHDKG